MTDRVVEITASGEPLGFDSVEAYAASRVLGRELVGRARGATTGGEPDGRLPVQQETLLDAQGVAEATHTSPSWWENAAARNQVPHYRIGRYIRFKLSEVLASGVRQGKRRVIGEAQQREPDLLPPARRLTVRRSKDHA